MGSSSLVKPLYNTKKLNYLLHWDYVGMVSSDFESNLAKSWLVHESMWHQTTNEGPEKKMKYRHLQLWHKDLCSSRATSHKRLIKKVCLYICFNKYISSCMHMSLLMEHITSIR